MPIGKSLRLRRLTSRGRAVIVAIDHGNVAGVVNGLEHPLEIVKMAAQNGADGVLLTPGMLELVYEELGNLGVVLRLDGAATVAGPPGPMRLFTSVEQAAEMGADAVVVNATVGTPHEGEELEKVGRVASEGRRWGVPVIAEMLTQGLLANHLDFNGRGSEPLPVRAIDEIAMAARVGVELGADFIKTRFAGDPDDFRRAAASAGRPILVAGGPQRDHRLDGILRLVDHALEGGAGGVVFGRQIWQSREPAEVLRAVCAMVHDDATVEEALHATPV